MVDWFVPAENPASVVYGVIAIGALLAAESSELTLELGVGVTMGVAIIVIRVLLHR